MPEPNMRDLIEHRNKLQWAFPMAVEAICLEITELSKDIGKAIGEISLDEAKECIIREFSKKVREPFDLR